MKKLGIFVMPVMAISFLIGCGDSTSPVAHTFHFIGTNCTINGESDYTHDIFEQDKNVQYTIIPNPGYNLPKTIEGVEYNPSNGVITITEIKSDIEVRAEATHTPQPGTAHTIHLDPAGGTITGDTILTNLPDGNPVTTAPTISRAGYDASQVKWYTEPDGGGQEFIFGPKGTGTDVVTDYFLHAKWGDINQFTINFYNDDGTKYDSLQNIKVNYGDKVTYKDCPTDSTYDNHYNFDGWYNKKPSEAGAELFSFDTPLTGDPTTISIYAKHTKKKYHVTFDANGGEITSGGTPLDVTYKDSISVDKRPTVSRSGYDPTTTWCTDKAGKNTFTFGKTQITDNTTLYAKWGEPEVTYTVTLDANGGNYITGSTFIFGVKKGDNLSKNIKSIAPPYTTGKIFGYYTYSDDSSIGYNDIVTDNVELKAHYFDSIELISHLDLLNISWDQIKAVAITNNPNLCFKLGALKTVTVNEKIHTVRIIGFNHDELKTSTATNPQYAGITFEFTNVISGNDGSGDKTYWNYKSGKQSTNYKYTDSTLCDYLNKGTGCVFNKLPGELKADGIIEEVYKPVAEKKSELSLDYEINTSYTAKLFPLSYREITEVSKPGEVKEEGTTYSFYTGSGDVNTNRFKRDVNGSIKEYWLRSPGINYYYHAWNVDSSGNFARGDIAQSSLTVAPAFCI